MPKQYAAFQAFAEEKYVPIPMTPVTSSQVEAVGYDAERRTLSVIFTRGPGHVYHYPDVSPEVHAAFVGAESIGKFFGQHIKALPFKKFPAPARTPSPA